MPLYFELLQLGALAEGLVLMYDGCIGTQKEEDKNENCLKSGVSKTKSRVRLSEMNFITPTTQNNLSLIIFSCSKPVISYHDNTTISDSRLSISYESKGTSSSFEII